MPLLLAQINSLLLGFLVVFFIVVSIAMILIVLIQRPQGGGLSGAFGAASDGAGQTAFGAKTGDMLTYATVLIFLVFLGFAIGLNYVVTDTVGPAPDAADAANEEQTTEPAIPAGGSIGRDGLDLGSIADDDETTNDETIEDETAEDESPEDESPEDAGEAKDEASETPDSGTESTGG